MDNAIKYKVLDARTMETMDEGLTHKDALEWADRLNRASGETRYHALRQDPPAEPYRSTFVTFPYA